MEIKVFTVATGQFKPFPIGKQKKMQNQVVEWVKSCEGFIGVYPFDSRGVLFLFKTENDAKRCRNLLKSKNVHPLGNNIGEVFIEEQYLKESEKCK